MSARVRATQRRWWWPLAWLGLSCAATRLAEAEPYLAVQNGYKCIDCHINPTGGGMRNTFGEAFAENLMPARPLPAGSAVWSGQLVQNILRLGGDLRADGSRTATPPASDQPANSQEQFALEQFRLYGYASVVPDRVALYVDEQIAPGAAQTMEAYVLYGNTSDWYLKGGQFYQPFGWRLQDQTTFVREVSGISMSLPADGVEFGLERPRWEAQFDVTNGVTAGAFANGVPNAVSPQPAPGGSSYQLTAQAIRTATLWRIGVAGSFTRADTGNRAMGALFAGLRTGPIAWLGEADVVRQAGYPDGMHTMVPTLAEMDWALRRGHNLKLTYEFYDPELSVPNNQQTRWSAVYEYTPLPFLQLRAGFRRYQGIPQSSKQNETFSFAELHGFF